MGHKIMSRRLLTRMVRFLRLRTAPVASEAYLNIERDYGYPRRDPPVDRA